MQRLLLTGSDPTPSWLEDADLSSTPFPRYLPNAAGSTPPAQTGHRTSLVNARHSRIRGTADNGFWAGSPASPTFGMLYDVIVTDPGWRGKIESARPNGGHGHGGYCQNYGAFGQKVVDTCVFVRGFTDGTAFKFYHEGVEANNKTSNFVARNSIFLGDFLVRALSEPVEDVLIENCVIVGNLLIGHNVISQRITVRDCLIFGNFDILNVNQAVLTNNTVVVYGPYRTPGMLYGPGNYGLGFGTLTNEAVNGLTVYTDQPNSVWNGWSTGVRASRGYPTYGVQVHSLAAAPAVVRRYDVPERETANVFVYNPSGAATVALDGYYRVRDVRREESAIHNALVMAGEPDLPLYWNPEDGIPSTLPNLFPTFGIFRLEPTTPEEIIVTIEERLIAVETELASIRTAYLAEVAAKDAQINTLTAERDAALASASVFRGVLGSVNALVAGYPPVA